MNRVLAPTLALAALAGLAAPMAAAQQPPPVPVSTRAAPPDAAAPADATPLVLDQGQMALGGRLSDVGHLWGDYKARFITDQGRVIDTANGLISHSEGQGYGMLLAVAANDRVAFERLWGWTRANLLVRGDELLAWRWEPNQRPAVADLNNASDGDLLVAWALAEAGEFWSEPSYTVAGRRVAVEVGRKAMLDKTQHGKVLLPGAFGFGARDRSDGPVLNLSYWIFPAFARLHLVAPEIDWSGLAESGLDLIKAARFGAAGLPTEWISARERKPRPADGFPAVFGYNAIRIPLYMAWAGVGERAHYAAFAAQWAGGYATAPAVVDVATAQPSERLAEPGYRTVAALVACAVSGTKFPADSFRPEPSEHYYPATLRLLSIVALKKRYRSCVPG